MAILIFPIALVAGWLFRSPKWAVAVTLAIGVAALVALWLLWLAGAMVSPLETLVLAFGPRSQRSSHTGSPAGGGSGTRSVVPERMGLLAGGPPDVSPPFGCSMSRWVSHCLQMRRHTSDGCTSSSRMRLLGPP